ncbi:pyridoxal phosphate-dependent aminotransferase [uncultured Methylobacterium sp.]|uniref:pyridoxal phosphate-dependent aminotransferase n=1 Tax=uncultured Methylobacterium sp. TaxID=157278 RepID=UPI0035CB0ED0
MSEPFALGAYLARWNHAGRHELAASDSETLPLAGLLALAEPDDLARWNDLALGYADPSGAPGLRALIAARHADATPGDVLCCAGAQEAVACVVRAVLTPADHAVVVLPIYQPSEQAVTGSCAASGVPLEDDGAWSLDIDRVAAAIRPNTRLVLTNFPNSPTGAAIDAARLGALVDLCRRHGLWLVNDEVYRQTDCGLSGDVPTVADLYERGVSINGLSKGFGLPGLRVGWAVCRDSGLLARALGAKSVLSSCLSAPSEVLARVALRAEAQILARTRAIGQRNHAVLRALIARRPDLFEPEPTRNLAFAFPRLRGPEGADRFALRLARDADLLVLPAALWRSPLAPIPTDRLRIGLGHAACEAALATLEHHLDPIPAGTARSPRDLHAVDAAQPARSAAAPIAGARMRSESIGVDTAST